MATGLYTADCLVRDPCPAWPDLLGRSTVFLSQTEFIGVDGGGNSSCDCRISCFCLLVGCVVVVVVVVLFAWVQPQLLED